MGNQGDRRKGEEQQEAPFVTAVQVDPHSPWTVPHPSIRSLPEEQADRVCRLRGTPPVGVVRPPALTSSGNSSPLVATPHGSCFSLVKEAFLEFRLGIFSLNSTN